MLEQAFSSTTDFFKYYNLAIVFIAFLIGINFLIVTFPRKNEQYIEDAMNGNLEGIRNYLSRGGDPYACGKNGFSILSAALSRKQIGVFKLYISRGLLDTITLSMLLKLGEINLIRDFLLSNGDPNERNELGIPILSQACMYSDDLELIQLLIDFGANLSLLDYQGNNVLHLIANDPSKAKLALFLIHYGVDVNATNTQGQTPIFNIVFRTLIDMSYRENLEFAEILYSRGASLNCLDYRGTSLSEFAKKYNDILFLDWLNKKTKS